MVNLFDIVQRAQNGAGMDNLSRQFGLSADQTRRAVEALLPIFSLGFQRSTQNPNTFADMLALIGSGRFAPFFDSGLNLSADAARAGGQQVMSQLFGRSDASQLIATQASAASGVTAQVLQALMPVLAAMLVGGLSRMASVEGFADFLRAWSDWLRALKPREARPANPTAEAFAAPFGAWMDMVSAFAGRPPGEPKRPVSPDPWTAMMSAVLGQGAAPRPPEPPPQVHDPFRTLMGMFEAGREIQAQQLAGLKKMLDGVWTAPGGVS